MCLFQRLQRGFPGGSHQQQIGNIGTTEELESKVGLWKGYSKSPSKSRVLLDAAEQIASVVG